MSASLFAFALRALRRRAGKSLALGGGLVFAVALLGAVTMLTGALRAEAERTRAASPDLVVQRLVGGRPTTVAVADAAAVADLAAVRSVTPRVWGYVFVPALQGNVTVVGVAKGGDPLAGAALAAGRAPNPGAHEAVLGLGVARALAMRLGDALALPSANAKPPALTLVGTFAGPTDLYTADVVLCDEDDARAVLGYAAEQATDLAVTLATPDEAPIVARDVVARIAGARVLDRTQLARVYHLAYGRRAGFVLAAALPALLALLVLAWDRASGLGESERREVAMLKAIGWTTREVLLAKLVESLMVGGVATALGLVLGYAWVFWLGAPGLAQAMVGWSVVYPESALTPAVDGADLLGAALAVLGPFTLLSIVPAWRAAIVDPADAMRR